MGIHNVRLTDPTNHLPSDLRFYLWPYFLKISPSYAEVHRLFTTNPRAPRRPRIPAALKAVAEVYEIVGDVYTQRVFDWPRDRWVEIFGLQLAAEQLKLLCVLKQGRQVSLDRLAPIFEKYLGTTRPNMDNPTTMIMAIPLDQKVETTISTIREAIRFYREQDVIDEDSEPTIPQLVLEESGPRLDNLIDMYKMVLYKAAHPEQTAWQIAYNLNCSPVHNQAIDDNANPDIAPEDARRYLNNIAARNLKTAFNIAENAARGKFPLADDVDTMTVDMRPYESIAALKDDPLPLAVVRNVIETENAVDDPMFADRGFTDGTVY